MGGARPKQFLDLGRRPLLAHSLLAFEQATEVTGVVLVSHADHLDEAQRVADAAGISKLMWVVTGGATRSDSSRAALAALPADDGLVLLHDAARPLIEAKTISAVVAALDTHRAAAPVIPASDTIIEAHDGEITAMPTRDSLRRMQTPQGFELATIREAYRLAGEDPAFEASDDCGVVHRYLPDVAIKLVEGSVLNLKVTGPIDLQMAEVFLGT